MKRMCKGDIKDKTRRGMKKEQMNEWMNEWMNETFPTIFPIKQFLQLPGPKSIFICCPSLAYQLSFPELSVLFVFRKSRKTGGGGREIGKIKEKLEKGRDGKVRNYAQWVDENRQLEWEV